MANVDELITKLAQNAGPVRPAPHPFMLGLAWMTAVALYLGVSLTVSGLRPDLAAKLHDPVFIAEIAALIAIFVSTALSAALLSYPDLHQKRRMALAPGLMFGLFALALTLACRADSPPAPLPAHSYQCTLSIILLAIPPAVASLYVMRKFTSTHYRWAGCIALLSAFSVGALWLRLHEVNESITHVIQWHYLPMIGVGIVGLWLGRILLKW